MKRNIAIFIVLAMLFALGGCGQQTGGTKTQESASTEEQMEQTAAQEGPTQDEQNDDTEDLFGYNFDTDDGIDNSSSNTSVSGTKNADGTYTHNVDGYELVLPFHPVCLPAAASPAKLFVISLQVHRTHRKILRHPAKDFRTLNRT
jgi:hypothetical protein